MLKNIIKKKLVVLIMSKNIIKEKISNINNYIII